MEALNLKEAEAGRSTQSKVTAQRSRYAWILDLSVMRRELLVAAKLHWTMKEV